MPRTYELKRRAERQRETRRRIIAATIELHTTVGPARTTIKGVAERAQVQRHTVYRHFPSEDELFAACTSTWDERNPFPDPQPWTRIADPEARLRRALTDVYGHYRRVEPDLSLFLRDADLVPAVRRALAEAAGHQQRIRNELARGWQARGRRRQLLLAAIGHGLEFEAWRSLVHAQDLGEDQAVDLMVKLARAAAEGGSPAAA